MRRLSTFAAVTTMLMSTMVVVRATPAVAAATPCSLGSLSFTVPSSTPVASAPGKYAQNTVTLRNKSGITLRNASFDFELVLNDSRSKAPPTPTVRWRLNHYRWHSLKLRWYRGTNGNLSYFESDDTGFATLKAGAVHSLTFQVAFHRGDPRTDYSSAVYAGSLVTCGRQLLGAGFINFAYMP